MKRNEQIDFVKCVMIFLMIAFHLVYIGDTYSRAKLFVYTFHMPVFLLLSGYLLNIGKPWRKFGRSMLFIAIPYAIMEAGYIIGASILPIREHIDHLTLGVFLDKLVLNPIGPYWYLQTIVICSIAYKLVHWAIQKTGHYNDIVMLIVLIVIYQGLSMLHCIAWSSYMYFTFGIIAHLIVSRKYEKVTDMPIRSHWAGVLLFVASAAFITNPDRGTPLGIAITALAFCTSLELHKVVSKWIPSLNSICLLIGRNTLLMLLFSPIFTILAKGYQPLLLSIEPTGMLFMVVSVIFAVAGSLAIGWVSDFIKVSPYIFGRQALTR